MFFNVTIGLYTKCEDRCVLQRECVSVNIGPVFNDSVICELSNSDHWQHDDDLLERPGWTYRGTEVQTEVTITKKEEDDGDDDDEYDVLKRITHSKAAPS